MTKEEHDNDSVVAIPRFEVYAIPQLDFYVIPALDLVCHSLA